MMVAFDDEAAGLHDLDHFGAEVLVVVGGGDGEVALFIAGAVAVVIVFAAGVPAALFGVDVVVAGVGGAVEAAGGLRNGSRPLAGAVRRRGGGGERRHRQGGGVRPDDRGRPGDAGSRHRQCPSLKRSGLGLANLP